MKKHLPLLVLFACALTAQAQIPNAGFEDWSAPNGFDDPDGWITYNGFTSQYGVLTCAEGQPGHTGDSYLALTSQNVPGFSVMPGMATTGDLVTGVEGFPYDQRPTELNGWWQHQSTGLDEGMVAVTFTKWNAGTQQREDIGAGYLFTAGNINSWAPFSVVIFYVSPDSPDTATITIASSASGLLTAGSTLFADDLAFDSSTGSDEDIVTAHPSLRLYPSPCDAQLTTENLPLGNWYVTDMTGRTVLTGRSNGAQRQLVNVSDLMPGAYFMVCEGSRRSPVRFVKR